MPSYPQPVHTVQNAYMAPPVWPVKDDLRKTPVTTPGSSEASAASAQRPTRPSCVVISETWL
jgi:hypothetical protein